MASLGQERSQHAAQAAGNSIYVWGGYNKVDASYLPVTLYSSLEIYDAATNTWRSGASVPTAMRGQAAAVGSNGLIYSFGGASASILDVSYRYNPATDSWATLATMPTGEWEASAARANNGRIYVFGGTSAPTANQIYNPTTNTWATGAAMPPGRHGTTMVRDASGLLHVLSGSVLGAFNTTLTTHEVYNPATNTWATAAALPVALNQASGTLGPDGNIYVVGGKADYFNNTGPFHSTVYVYTPGTNTWAQGPSLPLTLGETQAATIGSNVYTLAGTNGMQQKVAYQLAIGPSPLVDADAAANTVVQNAAGTAVGLTASSTDSGGQAST